MIKCLAFTVALCLVLNGCFLNKNAPEIAFVHEHGKDDFSMFMNKSLTLRGYDNDGNKIILVSDTLSCGYLWFTVDRNNFAVLRVKPRTFGSGCIVTADSAKILLAQKFAKYSANYLYSNKYNNVFFRTNSLEGKANLLLLNNPTDTSEVKLKEWEQLEGKWYVRIEE